MRKYKKHDLELWLEAIKREKKPVRSWCFWLLLFVILVLAYYCF